MEVRGGAERDEAVAVGEGGEDADFVGVFELGKRELVGGSWRGVWCGKSSGGSRWGGECTCARTAMMGVVLSRSV